MVVGYVAVILAAVTVCLLAIVVRATLYTARYPWRKFDRVKLSDLYGALKTGDLLFFTARRPQASAVLLTQQYYTHVGVVVADAAGVQIAESTPSSRLTPWTRMRDGADLVDLLPRLKYYAGDYFVARLSAPLPPKRAARVASEAARRSGYPSPIEVLAGGGTRRHCFQHAWHLLNIAGLVPPDTSRLGCTRGICELPGAGLANGLTYSRPIQIIYDIGTLKVGPEEASSDDASAHEVSADDASADGASADDASSDDASADDASIDDAVDLEDPVNDPDG
jgi:hypothetical protein